MKELLNKKKINILINKLRRLSLSDLIALRDLIERIIEEKTEGDS